MKTKLFSGKSVLVSVKGIVSSILTGLSAIPLWGLAFFFMKKGWIVLGGIFSLFMLVWYLFFWGFISSRMWRWN